VNHPARKSIDDFDRIIPERGDEQPLTFHIGAKVVQAAGNMRDGDLLLEL
jgi:hypothetical protein